MDINSQTAGLVVPTLGKRGDLLKITLDSIRESSNVYVVIVCPEETDLSAYVNLYNARVDDPGTGLPDAINQGFRSLPDEIELINWLGDDDYLEKNAIDNIRNLINSEDRFVAAFGQCAYVDADGNEIFINRTGRLAIPLLHVGPDLILQPGMLFKKSTFNQVGELSNDYGWAFDFDLLLKLKSVGKIAYLNKKVSSFRWHPGSLSVGQRKKSVQEASRVRKAHLHPIIRKISFLWEPIVMYLTLRTGERLSRKFN